MYLLSFISFFRPVTCCHWGGIDFAKKVVLRGMALTPGYLDLGIISSSFGKKTSCFCFLWNFHTFVTNGITWMTIDKYNR